MILQNKQIEPAYYKLHESEYYIYSAAISNDLQFIASGGSDNYLKIWDYQTNTLINQIKFNSRVYSLKFTDDSKILYVGTDRTLYQLFVPNKFKQLYKQRLHDGFGIVLYCIANATLLISFRDGIIMSSNITLRKLIFQIKAHSEYIWGLDYNRNLQIFASGSGDGSIKLWNGNDATLIIEQKNAHNTDKYGFIEQVFFLSNNQLIGLDSSENMIIWDINYQEKKLVRNQLLNDKAYNMSLVLDQYILTIGNNFIKIYAKNGQPFKQFDFDFEICGIIHIIIQLIYLIQFNQAQ